ncbi:tetratricopeptide repeat protein [Sediminicola luteus]|nr:tetratricopeptide repeat protein [Sediminicola luteus]
MMRWLPMLFFVFGMLQGIQAQTDTLLEQAEVYAQKNEWRQVAKIYEELLEDEPENAVYWYRYGGALAKRAQSGSKLWALTYLGTMENAFNMAVALDPKNREARWALIDFYVSVPGLVGGSFEKAMQQVEALMAISPMEGHLAKSYVYEYEEEEQLAQDEAELAYRLLKQYGPIKRNAIRYQIGKIGALYGIDPAQGKEQLQVYMANYSVYDGVPLAWAYFRMAQLYDCLKQPDLALDWCNKALQKAPRLKPAQEWLAQHRAKK